MKDRTVKTPDFVIFPSQDDDETTRRAVLITLAGEALLAIAALAGWLLARLTA